jgi:hypothetical protein
MKAMNDPAYNSHQVDFIPTGDDWTIFLSKWNQQVFEVLKVKNIKLSIYHHYQDTDYNCYHLPGATEAKIIELEQKIQINLSVGYKNFLLASNGFVSLDRHYMFCDTDKIDWFVQENRDWAERWGKSDLDVSDEEYFQYGENQNSCSSCESYTFY